MLAAVLPHVQTKPKVFFIFMLQIKVSEQFTQKKADKLKRQSTAHTSKRRTCQKKRRSRSSGNKRAIYTRKNKTRTVPFISKAKTARINGSRLISVLDSFSCELPVAAAIQHGARFKVTVSGCDLPQRQYFEDLFNENGESSLITKALFSRRIIKSNALFFCLFVLCVQFRKDKHFSDHTTFQ